MIKSLYHYLYANDLLCNNNSNTTAEGIGDGYADWRLNSYETGRARIDTGAACGIDWEIGRLYRAVGARPVHGEHPHAKAAGQCAFTGRKSDFL